MFYNKIGSIILAAAALALAAGAVPGCRDDQGPDRGTVLLPVECGASLNLGPGDAEPEDWSGAPRPWTLAANPGADRVTITRSGMCGDECNFVEELVLAPGSGSCPQFVSARRIIAEHGGALGTARDTVQAVEGRLTIQDWGYPTGPVSGRLTGNLEMTFYVAGGD
jgi:hypothetical protein